MRPAASETGRLLAESSERRSEAARRKRPLSPDERLDPNTASEEELDRLPGVGPATAKRIVRLREEKGAFSGVDDLLAVPGIGPVTLARMAPHLK
jgi:competence ComEA-like helix-hairpin-helix protein